jgi:hypothetical protein
MSYTIWIVSTAHAKACDLVNSGVQYSKKVLGHDNSDFSVGIRAFFVCWIFWLFVESNPMKN